MEQELSKCRNLDGYSAQVKFGQLLARVEEVKQQVSEWQAQETVAEAKTNAQQEIRDVSVVMLNRIKALEKEHDHFNTRLLRLWFRSDKFLSVLVPAANAAAMFKMRGWRTRNAMRVLMELTEKIDKIERRGFWRRLWRFIRGRHSS